jgi:hypothetical protein
MKLLTLIFVALWISYGQSRGTGTSQAPPDQIDARLARTQREALIKNDHKRNVEDAGALLKLAEELKADLDKDDAHVVSVRSIKQTEEMEKLCKSIRARLKRY